MIYTNKYPLFLSTDCCILILFNFFCGVKKETNLSPNVRRTCEHFENDIIVIVDTSPIIVFSVMKRKVAYPQVRVPTDQWSGLHLSKSEDFEALKKRNERVSYLMK